MHAFDFAAARRTRTAHPHGARRRARHHARRAGARAGGPTSWSSPTPTRAQAIGGVMGGADSEVSSATRLIALESAWFEPTGIRRTSKRLGLSTEASYRFERGADIEAPPVALARACALLEKTGAGRALPGWVDAYPVKARAPARASSKPRASRRCLAPTCRSRSSPARWRALASASRRALPHTWRPVSRASVRHQASPAFGHRRPARQQPDARRHARRHSAVVAHRRVARRRPHRGDRPPLRIRPPANHLPHARDRTCGSGSHACERDRLVRRLAAAAGFAEAVTFSFIERAGGGLVRRRIATSSKS